MFSGWNKISLIREVFTRCTEEFTNIVCIGVSTLPPPQKHPLPLSCQAPVKSANCPSRLKVTKFSVKISQFEFLVMPERNIFVYKLFLLLNISDFSLFLCKNWNHPKKGPPSVLATNRPSQVFLINRNATLKLSSINAIHVKQ